LDYMDHPSLLTWCGEVNLFPTAATVLDPSSIDYC
jgi:hypothetical protein